MRVRVRILRNCARLPVYATSGSSGMDLVAAIDEPVVIGSMEFATIPTGIALEIPAGFEGQIRARSGLASLYGIGVLNAPGTIDSDYRGEIKVILFNFGKEPFVVEPGTRIAQLVVAPVCKVELEIANELSETERKEGGFGHSGLGLPQSG